MKNPYTEKNSNAFWKHAVPLRKNESFDLIWTSKFPITPNLRFATAGSCFAQHISKWLKKNNYQWLDSEPGLAEFNQEQIKNEGYGVFTFRTGNIYTAPLFKQWIKWSLSGESDNEFWEEDGRYYDPFRPGIPENGFPSLDALVEAREYTLHCIKQTLKEIDVFVLTLGLTESWINTKSGLHYPLCPGTLRGSFSRDLHQFVNLNYEQILHDLNIAFDMIKAVNPDIRFLLTVSPVPLTATASENHVLVATNYSKSVLRAVAGDLSEFRSDTDYFPSYELIAGTPSQGRYFEKNMRTVKQSGVDFVMQHFAQGIGALVEKHRVIANDFSHTHFYQNSEAEQEKIFCEEIMLEKWSKNLIDEDVSICLFGDSQMGYLSESLNKRGINHAGGMIMNGSAWFRNEFHLDSEEFFVPLENSLARSRWRKTLEFFQKEKTNSGRKKWVITNIGMQNHMAAKPFNQWAAEYTKNNLLSIEACIDYYIEKNKNKIQLLQNLAAKGYNIIFMGDPPTQTRHTPNQYLAQAFETFEDIACHVMKINGFLSFSPRIALNISVVPEIYLSQKMSPFGHKDWIHGSDAYYEDICRILIDEYLSEENFDNV